MKKKKRQEIQTKLELITNDQDARNNGTSYKKTFHIKDLKHITPLTTNQRNALISHNSNMNTVLHGCAGTGKTFLSMYMALRDVFDENLPYNRLLIVRSVVPSRDIGFLPGTEEEKLAVYEQPYVSICNDLFHFKKSYENLKKAGYVDFTSTSYLRGMTFSNTIVLVDEIQNLSDDEINTIVTRLGINSRLMMCGDTNQKDLKNSGLSKNMKIFSNMKSIDIIEFGVEDIVRGGITKEYIIERNKSS